MFRAVNTESEFERKRYTAERHKIQKLYMSAQKSHNFEHFFNYNVCFDQNQPMYKTAKANLLFTLVNTHNVDELMNLADKYNFLETKTSFFEFVRTCLSERKYLQAKKLLNLANTKGWYCNEYFALKDKLNRKCKIEKKTMRFEDYL